MLARTLAALPTPKQAPRRLRSIREYRRTLTASSAQLPAGYDVVALPQQTPAGRPVIMDAPVGIFGAVATDGTIHATASLAREWSATIDTLRS